MYLKDKCKNKLSYSTQDKYWCGYSEKWQCNNRESCEWIDGGIGCRKDPSIVGCDYSTKKKCKQDPGCSWNKIYNKTFGCFKKAQQVDCKSFPSKKSCKSKSKYCRWDISNQECVDKI